MHKNPKPFLAPTCLTLVAQVTNLDGTTLPLLAFGRAHEALFREPEGMVIALFDAKPRRGEGGLSISVGDAKQIEVIGRCPDFGMCKALRKVYRVVLLGRSLLHAFHM